MPDSEVQDIIRSYARSSSCLCDTAESMHVLLNARRGCPTHEQSISMYLLNLQVLPQGQAAGWAA